MHIIRPKIRYSGKKKLQNIAFLDCPVRTSIETFWAYFEKVTEKFTDEKGKLALFCDF